MDISMDLSMDIHIHGNPDYRPLVAAADMWQDEIALCSLTVNGSFSEWHFSNRYESVDKISL